ncbi:MAG: hypothetical protein HY869_10485 [Chloroflexi bacterium]|nr:hypothetical protein [Chloroflexota bacterium]
MRLIILSGRETKTMTGLAFDPGGGRVDWIVRPVRYAAVKGMVALARGKLKP